MLTREMPKMHFFDPRWTRKNCGYLVLIAFYAEIGA